MHTDSISVTEEQYMAVRSYSTSLGGMALSALPVQFRFVQLDHRGGFCNCWAVANLTVTPPNGQTTKLLYVSHFSKLNYRPLKLFCRDTVITFQQGMRWKYLRSLRVTFGDTHRHCVKSDVRDIRQQHYCWILWGQ